MREKKERERGRELRKRGPHLPHSLFPPPPPELIPPPLRLLNLHFPPLQWQHPPSPHPLATISDTPTSFIASSITSATPHPLHPFASFALSFAPASSPSPSSSPVILLSPLPNKFLSLSSILPQTLTHGIPPQHHLPPFHLCKASISTKTHHPTSDQVMIHKIFMSALSSMMTEEKTVSLIKSRAT